MKKLLLIDGHNLLFKVFFGLPEKILPGGKSIQGVIGFISILVKIIRMTEPTHILVIFDPEEQPTRAALYPRYKSNREDFGSKTDRENPFTQLADIKTALDNLRIKHIEQSGYEADDMIASYASLTSCEVVIVSSDTDFLQLISDRVRMLKYRGKNGKKSLLYDRVMVQEKYGIEPSRFLEYKALIGDKTDDIEGLKGIGPKNALKVLNGERELTEEEQEVFTRNIKLIKLDTSAERPYSLNLLLNTDKFEAFKAYHFLQDIGVL